MSSINEFILEQKNVEGVSLKDITGKEFVRYFNDILADIQSMKEKYGVDLSDEFFRSLLEIVLFILALKLSNKEAGEKSRKLYAIESVLHKVAASPFAGRYMENINPNLLGFTRKLL